MSNNLLSKLALLFDKGPKKKIREEILTYYAGVPNTAIDAETAEALTFLQNNRLHVFPYDFTNNYRKHSIKVYEDKALGLRYVMHEGKKLYFKRNWSARKIKRNYNFLLLEQDAKSPHKYLTADFTVEKGAVVADAGAAEGNFALSIIEYVRKVYLFETDSEWIEALEATFAPWKDKVEIVNKFVSNKNDAHHVSLDNFFKGKEQVTFIKADVEGAEADLLEGSADMLANNSNLKVAITSYHKQADQVTLPEILKQFGFKTEFSDGYMVFYEYEPLSPPYFKRGLIRAAK